MWTIGFLHVIIGLVMSCSKVYGTIDVNLSELKYLAARLDSFECRRLVTALHYTTYELPQNLATAERKVDEEIPCLRQLLHWSESPTEGKGKTHAEITHRLRQLQREDLADWLGKTTFRQLGKDLDNIVMSVSLEEMSDGEETKATTTSAQFHVVDHILDSPVVWTREEDSWLSINIILMVLVLGLFGILLVLVAVVIIHTVKNNKN